MALKSGRLAGFAAQQCFMRCASAGRQLGGSGGRSFYQIYEKQKGSEHQDLRLLYLLKN